MTFRGVRVEVGHPDFKGLTDATPDNRPLADYPRDGLTRLQISRLILPLNVSSSNPASIASAHTDMLGTGGPVVTVVAGLNVLLLITESIVSAVVVATLISGPVVVELTGTTIVAGVDDPKPKLLNVHVMSVVPLHDPPPVVTDDTNVVPGGILSLTCTLVAAVVVLKLVTVSV